MYFIVLRRPALFLVAYRMAMEKNEIYSNSFIETMAMFNEIKKEVLNK